MTGGPIACGSSPNTDFHILGRTIAGVVEAVLDPAACRDELDLARYGAASVREAPHVLQRSTAYERDDVDSVDRLWPDFGTRCEHRVVEHAQVAEAVAFGMEVACKREVVQRVQPRAAGRAEAGMRPDLDHGDTKR